MKKGVLILLAIITGICLLWPDRMYSETERRKLKTFPSFRVSSVVSGRFMSEFETYALDQFPLRDFFLKLSQKITLTKDVEGIYMADGHISKMEYPLNEENVERALRKMEEIEQKYLNGCTVYRAVIPDKNYYLAKGNGYLSMDYETLFQRTDGISICDLLDASSYFYTDLHWRQEEIVDIANRISKEMGITLPTDYEEHVVEEPFYGVFAGQYQNHMLKDEIRYLTNDTIDQFTVYNGEEDKEIPVYDLKKAVGRDGYEMFLGGALSLVSIENPKGISGKNLVMFRDSFASSLAPLLAQGYQTVTLVDIRYVPIERIADRIDFNGADVLFLYSTSVLNHWEW